MTEEESKMVRRLHDAFLKVPEGSRPETRPLLEDIRMVVAAYHRASWLTRLIIWALPTLAGLGFAIQAIRDWQIWGGK